MRKELLPRVAGALLGGLVLGPALCLGVGASSAPGSESVDRSGPSEAPPERSRPRALENVRVLAVSEVDGTAAFSFLGRPLESVSEGDPLLDESATLVEVLADRIVVDVADTGSGVVRAWVFLAVGAGPSRVLVLDPAPPADRIIEMPPGQLGSASREGSE